MRKERFLITITSETNVSEEIKDLQSALVNKSINKIESQHLLKEVEEVLNDMLKRAKELVSCGCQFDMERTIDSSSCIVYVTTQSSKKGKTFIDKIKGIFSS